MFERFSDRARQAIVLAQQEARQLNHNYIGTEHILLGLLRDPDAVAARALDSCGVSADGVRDQVVSTVGVGKKPPNDGHIPFTPRAKKVLELSLREALRMGHDYIGTEHILLGLVREGEGVAATILAQHSDYEGLHRAVVEMVPQGRTTKSKRRWLRGHEAEPEGMRTTPAAAVGIAEARRLAGGDAIGSQHLLLAALSDPGSVAAKALSSLGVDLTRARDALRQVDIAGTSDELPEEAGRRQMRLRLADDVLTLEITDPTLIAATQTALDALGDEARKSNEISGDSPAAAGFADVWQALQATLDDIAHRAAPPKSA